MKTSDCIFAAAIMLLAACGLFVSTQDLTHVSLTVPARLRIYARVIALPGRMIADEYAPLPVVTPYGTERSKE